MVKEIITKRLSVRPYKQADLPALSELLTNPDIRKTYMLPVFSSDAAVGSLCTRLMGLSRAADGFERGIYLNGHLIGFVNDVSIKGNIIELGYAIHPMYQGQGYATEMLPAVMEALYEEGFHTISACAFTDNPASIRVMEKSGMVRLDKQTALVYDGDLRTCVHYERTK